MKRFFVSIAVCMLGVALYLEYLPQAAGRQGRGRGGYGRQGWGGWGRNVDRDRYLTRDIFPGNTFTFCRVKYTSVHQGGGRWGGRGFDWDTDYPESDLNFSLRLSQLTTIKVNRDAAGNIEHAVVNLVDEELFNYPFIYMLEVEDLVFSEAERVALRSYLLRGGFLMVDDFWGDRAWENWEYEIGWVLPPEEYPIVELKPPHPLFNIVFPLKEVPQVPSVGHYRQWEMTGDTYEGRHPAVDHSAHCRAIFDKKGRLMVVAMHNTDLGDGWEREGDNEGYFREFSVKRAYPMGINIVVYAMTH